MSGRRQPRAAVPPSPRGHHHHVRPGSREALRIGRVFGTQQHDVRAGSELRDVRRRRRLLAGIPRLANYPSAHPRDSVSEECEDAAGATGDRAGDLHGPRACARRLRRGSQAVSPTGRRGGVTDSPRTSGEQRRPAATPRSTSTSVTYNTLPDLTVLTTVRSADRVRGHGPSTRRARRASARSSVASYTAGVASPTRCSPTHRIVRRCACS